MGVLGRANLYVLLTQLHQPDGLQVPLPPMPIPPGWASSTAPAGMYGFEGGSDAMGSGRDAPLDMRGGSASILPALEVQSRTAELHFKVDSLESDLRCGECQVVWEMRCRVVELGSMLDG